MMILFLIITAALTLYAVFQIIAPFFQSREEQLRFEVLDEDLRSIEEMVARRSYLMKSLRELQLDHETGKIPDDDYERTRKKLELEAVKVLRELDEVHGGRGWQEAIDAELDERLEGIRRRRTGQLDEEDQPAQDTSEEPDHQADTSAQVECPECGKKMEADARFCSRCGHSFGDEGEAPETSEDLDEIEGEEESAETAPVDEMMSEQKSDIGDASAEVVR